jgi:hypothetical protein
MTKQCCVLFILENTSAFVVKGCLVHLFAPCKRHVPMEHLIFWLFYSTVSNSCSCTVTMHIACAHA